MFDNEQVLNVYTRTETCLLLVLFRVKSRLPNLIKLRYNKHAMFFLT